MSKDKLEDYISKEWAKIRKASEIATTPDGKAVTHTEYMKQEKEKEQAQNDNKKAGNNDQQVHYITEIIYDNPLLNRYLRNLLNLSQI